MKLRYVGTVYTNLWVIIESNPTTPEWTIVDCCMPKHIGDKYKDMNEFVMCNPSFVEDTAYRVLGMGNQPAKSDQEWQDKLANDYKSWYDKLNEKPKQHTHNLKERVLFTSVEEYCDGCSYIKTKGKAS